MALRLRLAPPSRASSARRVAPLRRTRPRARAPARRRGALPAARRVREARPVRRAAPRPAARGGHRLRSRALRDRVPPLPFERIRAVVEARARPAARARLRRRSSPTPLGAASIAQAHRARAARTATPVVVKVQYPWLAASLAADLRLVRWLPRAAFARGRGRASGRRGRSSDEFARRPARGARLRARGARRCGDRARTSRATPRVVVPAVIASHSHAPRAHDAATAPPCASATARGCARLGVEPRAVLEILARAYATQVFVDGLFHADPHPGNLFVLDEPGAARAAAPAVRRLRALAPARPRAAPRDAARDLRAAPARPRRPSSTACSGSAHDRAGRARATSRRAVAAMFERIAGRRRRRSRLPARAGALAEGRGEACCLQQTPGLQPPERPAALREDALLRVRARRASSTREVDMVKLCLPAMLRFLSLRSRRRPGLLLLPWRASRSGASDVPSPGEESLSRVQRRARHVLILRWLTRSTAARSSPTAPTSGRQRRWRACPRRRARPAPSTAS